MKLWKYIVGIVLFWILMFSIIVPKLIENYFRDIDQLIEEEFNKRASELMRDEIIRQLKEKEGKTIEDYYIEEFFRRRTK